MPRPAITDRSAPNAPHPGSRAPRARLIRVLASLAGVSWLATLVACVPDPPHTFRSLAPNDRLDAIVEASDKTDHDSLLGLVDQLSSDDPAARVLAIAALRKRTGESFGYEPADPEWRREPAATRWREYARSLSPAPEGSPGEPGAAVVERSEPGLPGPGLAGSGRETEERGNDG